MDKNHVKNLYLLDFSNRFCIKNYITFRPVKALPIYKWKLAQQIVIHLWITVLNLKVYLCMLIIIFVPTAL